jgi:hypothetical protein
MTFELEKKYEAEACVNYFEDMGYKVTRKGCKVTINEKDEKKGSYYFDYFKKYVLCSC